MTQHEDRQKQHWQQTAEQLTIHARCGTRKSPMKTLQPFDMLPSSAAAAGLAAAAIAAAAGADPSQTGQQRQQQRVGN